MKRVENRGSPGIQDRMDEVLRRKAQAEKIVAARREALRKEQLEKSSKIQNQRDSEKRERARKLHEKELLRQKEALDRRHAYLEAQNAKKEAILAKAHAAASRVAAARNPKQPQFAFGSSTPRELAYLSHLSKEQKVYDKRLISSGGTTPLPITASVYLPSKVNAMTSSVYVPSSTPRTTRPSPPKQIILKSSPMTRSMHVGGGGDRPPKATTPTRPPKAATPTRPPIQRKKETTPKNTATHPTHKVAPVPHKDENKILESDTESGDAGFSENGSYEKASTEGTPVHVAAPVTIQVPTIAEVTKETQEQKEDAEVIVEKRTESPDTVTPRVEHKAIVEVGTRAENPPDVQVEDEYLKEDTPHILPRHTSNQQTPVLGTSLLVELQQVMEPPEVTPIKEAKEVHLVEPVAAPPSPDLIPETPLLDFNSSVPAVPIVPPPVEFVEPPAAPAAPAAEPASPPVTMPTPIASVAAIPFVPVATVPPTVAAVSPVAPQNVPTSVENPLIDCNFPMDESFSSTSPKVEKPSAILALADNSAKERDERKARLAAIMNRTRGAAAPAAASDTASPPAPTTDTSSLLARIANITSNSRLREATDKSSTDDLSKSNGDLASGHIVPVP